MPPELEDKPADQPKPPEADVTKLLADIEAERQARQKTEQAFKESQTKLTELEKQLEGYKAVDPDKYQKLLAEQASREEADLLKKKQFEEAKQRYQAEASAAQKTAQEAQIKLESLTIETQIKNAFFESGGKRLEYKLENEGENIAPVDALLAVIRPRLKLEDGAVRVLNPTGEIELNPETGKPKTLSEKMAEFRQGSLGYLFEPVNKNTGGGKPPTTASVGGKQVTVYTREQARQGRVPMDEVASGKAVIQ